jgi:hypothetical protein
MSGRGRVNPEDRVEYEYEFVDGKRKAPRVVILGGGSPAGGPPAGGPPQTQRHNSRGALLASSFSTKQTVACRLFTRVAFFFPVSAGFFYSLPRVASRRWSTPHATRFYPDFVALSPLPRYYLPLMCATGHLFRCCWLVRWLRLLLWCSSLSLPATLCARIRFAPFFPGGSRSLSYFLTIGSSSTSSRGLLTLLCPSGLVCIVHHFLSPLALPLSRLLLALLNDYGRVLVLSPPPRTTTHTLPSPSRSPSRPCTHTHDGVRARCPHRLRRCHVQATCPPEDRRPVRAALPTTATAALPRTRDTTIQPGSGARIASLTSPTPPCSAAAEEGAAVAAAADMVAAAASTPCLTTGGHPPTSGPPPPSAAATPAVTRYE